VGYIGIRVRPKMPRRNTGSKPDVIGEWSEDKLAILQEYLHAYSVIMNKYKNLGYFSAYHYVDAFSGAVLAEPKRRNGDKDEATRFIEGSPLRALQTEPPFDVCWFIELSAGRSQRLAELVKQFPERDIRVVRGDCNAVLLDKIIPVITRNSRQRGVVFLDPYGLHIRWETIKALAAAGTLDILVNFSIMSLTRNLRRGAKPTEAESAELSEIMGSADWVDELYESNRADLWGAPIEGRDVIDADWLAGKYAENLSQLFEYVSKPIIMHNSLHSPLYALLVASHKKAATNITNDIIRKYEAVAAARPTVKSSRKKQPPTSDAIQTSFLE
jgi:three-Cys-motif partner protein